MNLIWRILERLPGSPEIAQLRRELKLYKTPFPPGHFYSPVPSWADIDKRETRLFSREDELLGIDLNAAEQLEYLRHFSELRERVPFYDPTRRIRFNIENGAFNYDDAPILSYMMRFLNPRRIIEVGSGHSSACMLDTNDLCLDGQVMFTFIDPYCDPLRTVLKPEDYQRVTIIEKELQDVDLHLFEELEANDILFVDSSHVMKIGSDVHSLLFEVFPRLRPGVHVHVHDVRYPFQYFKPFLENGYYWNEAYCLRAFLQFNSAFRIVFWLNYLINRHSDAVRTLLSDSLANDKYLGGSIWLVRC